MGEPWGNVKAYIEKRISGTGVTSYRVQIRIKGDKPTHATFRGLTDARKWAQETGNAIRDGKYFAIQNTRQHKVQQLVDRYISEMSRPILDLAAT